VLIPTKAVTDSDLIPATRSDAMPAAIGAKRRWRCYGAGSGRHRSTGIYFRLHLLFLSFFENKARRRRGGNVGNPALLPDFQARWEEWKTRFLSFPRFPRGVISTALLISSSSERSDAAIGSLFLSSFLAFFFVLGQNLTLTLKNLAARMP